MDVNEEKRAAFNEQMNQWVSRQGLWFQLRHAADGQTVAARLVRVFIRLFILLAICCLLLWAYLVNRVESNVFNDEIRVAIEHSLKADNCEVEQITKLRDNITIASVAADGGDESFFHKAEARLIRLNMHIINGLIGKWNAGSINISQLDLEVKAGERDDAAAAKSFSALFQKYEDFEFERILVEKANIEWGYSTTNRGAISNSLMSVVRDGEAWNIELEGGTFSQNWLRNLEIKKMTVICDKQGVHIKNATLALGSGIIEFSLGMGSGGQPDVNGELTMTSMPLNGMLPEQYADWLNGSISGKGTISGSTNSQEGVVFEIDLSIGDGDKVVLRDRLPLLSALSVVDLYNSYRKVSFVEGGLRIRTGGNCLEVANLDVRAGDLLHLKDGNFVVRTPNHQEIASTLNIKDVKDVTDVIEKNWKFKDDKITNPYDDDFDMSDVAGEVGGMTKQPNDDISGAERVFVNSILNEMFVRRFEGLIKIGLKSDAFDKAEKLKAFYPVDENSRRIWMPIPLSGRLQTLTREQAEQLYVLGKNRL